MRRPFHPPAAAWIAAVSLAAALATGCGHATDTGPGPPAGSARSYRMGFSGIPPDTSVATAVAALEMWTGRRGDAAILHVEPPWDSLLAGVRADSLVLRQQLELVHYYRAKGCALFMTVDLTDGLDRSTESPALVAAGRSLAEPAVQQAARAWIVAADTLLRPAWLGLAAETNLIRAAAPPALYAAVVQAANAAAGDVRAVDPAVRLYVSVQVDVAWGRLGGGGGTPVYGGVAADLADFPFVAGLGLSSYPYLAAFDEPEDVPLDYYGRVATEAMRPVFVVEGGWSSEPVGALVTSPALQARWIRRQMALADQAHAAAVFQLTFTDLDLSSYPQPPGSILPYFAWLGLVDTHLAPKPALAPWDSAFARSYRP